MHSFCRMPLKCMQAPTWLQPTQVLCNYGNHQAVKITTLFAVSVLLHECNYGGPLVSTLLIQKLLSAHLKIVIISTRWWTKTIQSVTKLTWFVSHSTRSVTKLTRFVTCLTRSPTVEKIFLIYIMFNSIRQKINSIGRKIDLVVYPKNRLDPYLEEFWDLRQEPTEN